MRIAGVSATEHTVCRGLLSMIFVTGPQTTVGWGGLRFISFFSNELCGNCGGVGAIGYTLSHKILTEFQKPSADVNLLFYTWHHTNETCFSDPPPLLLSSSCGQLHNPRCMASPYDMPSARDSLSDMTGWSVGPLPFTRCGLFSERSYCHRQ